MPKKIKRHPLSLDLERRRKRRREITRRWRLKIKKWLASEGYTSEAKYILAKYYEAMGINQKEKKI